MRNALQIFGNNIENMRNVFQIFSIAIENKRNHILKLINCSHVQKDQFYSSQCGVQVLKKGFTFKVLDVVAFKRMILFSFICNFMHFNYLYRYEAACSEREKAAV